MAEFSLLPDTARIGRTALLVTDLDGMIDFYRDVVGLSVLTRRETTATLGVGETPLLVLDRDESASPRATTRRDSSTTRSKSQRGPRSVPHSSGSASAGTWRRRVRSLRERSAVLHRSRGQRHRNLYRPAASGAGRVRATGRYGSERPRSISRTSPPSRTEARTLPPERRPSDTSTWKCPRSTRRGSSTSRRWD